MSKTHSELNKAYEESHRHPCPSCGKLIHRRSKLCPDCYNKSRAAKQKVCVDCGKPVKLYTAQRCRPCADKHLKEMFDAGERIIEVKFGSAHHNWKGGKCISNGYVMRLKPEHPRANRDGYVREHILVWEQAQGVPLPRNRVIHHLNGVKDDNCPENLVAITQGEHRKLHSIRAARIKELEAKLNRQAQLI